MSRIASTLSVLMLLFISACAQRPSVSEHQVGQALLQREQAFLAALSARDVEQTAAFFAEDASLHLANMPPVQGRSAIEQFYRNVFRFLQASTALPERMQVAASVDLAYSAGQVNNVFASEQGQSAYAGKYLLVWEWREGDWFIVFYSLSSNQAEMRR